MFFEKTRARFPRQKKRWIKKKGNETRSSKMDLKKNGSSFEKVDLRLESLDLS